MIFYQPPSGGCELKLHILVNRFAYRYQPPSGGCELKPGIQNINLIFNKPAAFGRL